MFDPGEVRLDFRTASDIETRPSATYVRVSRKLDDSVLADIAKIVEHDLAIGALMVSEAGELTRDELLRLSSNIGRPLHCAPLEGSITTELQTLGARIAEPPDIALIYARAQADIVLADFSCFCWRITPADVAILRQSTGPHGAAGIIYGDPGRPLLQYDVANFPPMSESSAAALHALQLGLLVPGVKLKLRIPASSILILDTQRMLVSINNVHNGISGEMLLLRRYC